jgi:ABC-type Fe2+-enterobactin transport system substrate-binding protein
MLLAQVHDALHNRCNKNSTANMVNIDLKRLAALAAGSSFLISCSQKKYNNGCA